MKAKVDPPNEEIDILAADQIFTDTQVLSIEQLDYSGTAIERSHGKDNDFWAEEDAVSLSTAGVSSSRVGNVFC